MARERRRARPGATPSVTTPTRPGGASMPAQRVAAISTGSGSSATPAGTLGEQACQREDGARPPAGGLAQVVPVLEVEPELLVRLAPRGLRRCLAAARRAARELPGGAVAVRVADPEDAAGGVAKRRTSPRAAAAGVASDHARSPQYATR